MTRTKTASRKYRPVPGRQAQILLKDFSNTFLSAADPAVLSLLSDAMGGAMDKAMGLCLKDCARLWTDGSYNESTRSAGIGVMYQPRQGEPKMLGKPVRAAGSEEAELYAMAVGLSYVLDTYPDARYVLLQYDCTAAAVNAANIDAFSGRGAPYTNMRNAMKRCRKAGVTVLFRHVKSHAGSRENNLCDLMAKYHAKAALSQKQMAALAPWLPPSKTRKEAEPHGRKPKNGEKA